MFLLMALRPITLRNLVGALAFRVLAVRIEAGELSAAAIKGVSSRRRRARA